jgi:periplasmic divalent cation tolerance protein
LIFEFVSGFDIRISVLPDSSDFNQLPEGELNSGTKHYRVPHKDGGGPMHVRFVYMTAGNLEEAQKIGRELVSAGLAACVNILPHMNSIYVWEGKIEEASEVVLIAKTVEARVADLVAKVKSLHTYSCPCIVSLRVEDGYPPFLEWVAETVKI